MKYGHTLIAICLVAAAGCGDSRPGSLIGPTTVTGTTAAVGAYTLSGTIRDLDLSSRLKGRLLGVVRHSVRRRGPGGRYKVIDDSPSGSGHDLVGNRTRRSMRPRWMGCTRALSDYLLHSANLRHARSGAHMDWPQRTRPGVRWAGLRPAPGAGRDSRPGARRARQPPRDPDQFVLLATGVRAPLRVPFDALSGGGGAEL